MIQRWWDGLWGAVLLVGIPVVLVRTVGNPLPARRDLPALIQEPLTEQNIYAAIAVVAWLIWVGVLYAVIVEVGLRARRSVRWLRGLPRLPLPTRLRGLAGGLLGAVAVTATQTGAGSTPAAAAMSTTDSVGQMSMSGPGRTVQAEMSVADGVELPDGGWLPDPVAQAVQAAAAAVWWRRRRQYDPTSPHTAPGEVGLLPLTARAAQAALADAVPATETQAHLPGRGVHDLPAGGVGLTGPGAAAAARGVLVALLLSHHGDHPRVVTTADDLETLLAGRADSQPRPDGLHVAKDLADACAVLDAMVVERPGRPVTVITTAPGEAGPVRRLAALLTLGAQQGLSAVILGRWPYGTTTWHLDTEGHTDGARARLTVLTATAAADLLTLTALRTGEHPTGPVASPFSPANAGPVTQARLRLTLLGRVTVAGDQGPVTIRRSAATQVLVFLALHPAGATTTELCEAIWPHLRPHTAAGRFYTTISELRAALRAASGGRELISHIDDRYLLEATLVDTDVNRLLAANLRASTAPDPAGRQAALREVIGQYRGELAAGHTWPWLEPLREQLRRQVMDAYAQLAAEHPEHAARLWRDAARVDPINEHLHQHALYALTAAGDHHAAAALRADHARHLAATDSREPSDQGV